MVRQLLLPAVPATAIPKAIPWPAPRMEANASAITNFTEANKKQIATVTHLAKAPRARSVVGQRALAYSRLPLPPAEHVPGTLVPTKYALSAIRKAPSSKHRWFVYEYFPSMNWPGAGLDIKLGADMTFFLLLRFFKDAPDIR